jgi:hypothetical protein
MTGRALPFKMLDMIPDVDGTLVTTGRTTCAQ